MWAEEYLMAGDKPGDVPSMLAFVIRKTSEAEPSREILASFDKEVRTQYKKKRDAVSREANREKIANVKFVS